VPEAPRGGQRGKRPGATARADGPKPERPPAPLHAHRPVGPGTAGARLRELYAGAYREGWPGLLELVLLGMVWSLCMVVGGAALVGNLAHGTFFVGFALPAVALWAPATLGLHAAADAIWSGDAVGPFDALRNFARGFGRRYLRGVGLSALWVLVLVGTYANIRLSPHVLPHVLMLGARIILGYLVLFVLMVDVYLVPILATTDLGVWAALRLAAWEAVANPLFTLGAMLAPAVVILVGFMLGLLTAIILWAMLLGGVIGLFAAGALRYAPLRHPDLPEPVWMQEPLPDAELAADADAAARPGALPPGPAKAGRDQGDGRAPHEPR
jgi:uncharacterized membrane protein YesL